MLLRTAISGSSPEMQSSQNDPLAARYRSMNADDAGSLNSSSEAVGEITANLSRSSSISTGVGTPSGSLFRLDSRELLPALRGSRHVNRHGRVTSRIGHDNASNSTNSRAQASPRASETVQSNASHPTLHKHSLTLKWSPAIKRVDREIECKVFRRQFFNSGLTFARVDRFVPIRNYSTPCSERYRTNKEPDTLSRTERAMRAGVCPVLRSFHLHQTLSMVYSLLSFRPSPDIGTSSRTGKITTALSLGYPKGLKKYNQGHFQRVFPLFGHGLTLPPDLWPYSQIVSESSTEDSLVHRPTNAHAQSLKRPFAGRRQKSEHERIQNSLGVALNINFFRKILDFNLEPSSVSSAIPLGDSAMGTFSGRSKEATLPGSSSAIGSRKL